MSDKELNIVFVVLDALRARNLSCYGYSKPTSPNIDNLAREGILFENAFSCINTTDPSLTTIFSGEYPLSHGIINHGAAVQKAEVERLEHSDVVFLPEILKTHGYTTLALDWLDRWHKRGYDFYEGLPDSVLEGSSVEPSLKERFAEKLSKVVRRFPSPIYRLSRALYAGMKMGAHVKYFDARMLTSAALKLMTENIDRKFFLFIHYWDIHDYRSPKRYIDKFREDGTAYSPEEILSQTTYGTTNPRFREYLLQFVKDRDIKNVNDITVRYDAAINYVDQEIGRLMQFLDKTGISQNTLVILTADHGESLLEHGIYRDHHGLYDVSIHVPLIIWHPAFAGNQRVSGFVQHFDLVPTLLDLLEIPADTYDFDGKSFLALIKRQTHQLRQAIYAMETHFSQRSCIRTSKYKYICASSEEAAVCKRCGIVHGEVEELYDLEKDPQETNNIVKDNAQEASQLRQMLSKWEERLEEKKRVKNAIRKRINELKSLGKI